MARAPIVLAVIVLLVVGGLVDRAQSGPSAPPPLATLSGAVSVAAPPGALSSSWFCGGATDGKKSEAPGELVVTNAGNHAIAGTATLVTSTGKRRVVPVAVGASAEQQIPETVPGGAPWIGALVNLQGGQATVEQRIVGSLGTSSTPCATRGSRSWYFTSGATLVNAGVELTLLNPYPVDAIADLTFTTNQGAEQPGDFQGLVVPARGLLAVDLGSHLRRRRRIATTVSVSSGRVVAWKTDIVTPPAKGEATIGSRAAATSPDPAAPIGGAAVTLGSPSAGTTWSWPEGDSGNGFQERYVVYNPGTATADVSLAIGLDTGIAEPLSVTVAPGSVWTVVSASEARVPAGVGHSATVRSTNGVPVVAERTLAVGHPSPFSGLGELPGLRTPAQNWLLAAAPSAPTIHTYLVIYNPGRATTKVTVEGLRDGESEPVPGVAPFLLRGHKRASILLNNDGAAAEPLVVRGTLPILAERDSYGGGKAAGVSLSPGVPLSP